MSTYPMCADVLQYTVYLNVFMFIMLFFSSIVVTNPSQNWHLYWDSCVIVFLFTEMILNNENVDQLQ